MKIKKSLWAVLLAFVFIFQVVLGAVGCAQTSQQPAVETPATVQITDHADREVTIPAPDKIEKVFFTSPLGMIMVYTLVPDKLAGTSMELSEAELKYLDPSLGELPMLGGLQSGSELNREALISSGAQIVFSIGPNITDTTVSEADELQEQLGIPVVVVDGAMEKAADSYTFLGGILGEEERAKELGDYCTSVFEDVVDKVSAIPEDKKVSVYYAEKADGLSTEPVTSSHAAVLKYAGAKNVADVEAVKGSGFSSVSLEQVLAWNPQVIISWGDDRGGAYSMIKENADWANIEAVKSGDIYSMPNLPYSWMDRPPSVNRFLGIQWVANLLYPDVYSVDIKEQAKEFYELFYHVKLSDQEVGDILKNAI